MIDLDVQDEKNNMTRRYRANALILAMPQRSLELVAQKTELLSRPDVSDLLRAVMPMPAYKTLAVYNRPWWKDVGLVAGRSTTDLPVRQVYYMHSGEEPDTTSMMLATYADGRTQSFWNALYHGGEIAEKFQTTPNRYSGLHALTAAACWRPWWRPRFHLDAAGVARGNAPTAVGSDTRPDASPGLGLGRRSVRRRMAFLAAGSQGLGDAAARPPAGHLAASAYLRGSLHQPTGLG